MLRENARMLDCILPTGVDEYRNLRLIMLNVFTYPWATGAEANFSVYASDEESDMQVRVRLHQVVAPVLFGCIPPGFPTRSWAKCEKAPTWIATLELASLFSPIFLSFCEMLGSSDTVAVEAIAAPPLAPIVDFDQGQASLEYMLSILSPLLLLLTLFLLILL